MNDRHGITPLHTAELRAAQTDRHGETLTYGEAALERLEGMADSYRGEAIYPFATHVVAELRRQNNRIEKAIANLDTAIVALSEQTERLAEDTQPRGRLFRPGGGDAA